MAHIIYIILSALFAGGVGILTADRKGHNTVVWFFIPLAAALVGGVAFSSATTGFLYTAVAAVGTSLPALIFINYLPVPGPKD